MLCIFVTACGPEDPRTIDIRSSECGPLSSLIQGHDGVTLVARKEVSFHRTSLSNNTHIHQ